MVYGHWMRKRRPADSGAARLRQQHVLKQLDPVSLGIVNPSKMAVIVFFDLADYQGTSMGLTRRSILMTYAVR
jgi:hypothetical protein